MSSKFTSNSTMIPNAFVDDIMCKLSANATKIYLLILRKTTGWQKEFDSISISQFMKFTGIKRKETVRFALSELEKYNLITAELKAGKPTLFSLIKEADPDGKSVPHGKSDPDGKSGRTQTEKPSDTQTENPSPQKKLPKETIQKKKEKKFVLANSINKELWESFVQHRRDIKKVMSIQAKTLNANLLRKLTHDEQKFLINYSISGGYPSIYLNQLKNYTAGQNETGRSNYQSGSYTELEAANDRALEHLRQLEQREGISKVMDNAANTLSAEGFY